MDYRAQQPSMFLQPRMEQQPQYVEVMPQQQSSSSWSSLFGYGLLGCGMGLAAAAYMAGDRRVAAFTVTADSGSALIMDTSKSPKPYLKYQDELMKTASYIASPGCG